MTKEQLLTDLIVAYRDARKRVRNRTYQLSFEMNVETELVRLRDELWSGQWKPGQAEAFIVFRPVQREVFASQFRDRVVHHLLFNYIAPMMDNLFIRDSYSCRKGKGTSDAVNRLCHHCQSASSFYTRKSYILKMDIKGYFMGIDQIKLESYVKKHLDRHWKRPEDRGFIDYLVHTIISSDVTKDCIIRGKMSDWRGLPSSKSLFYAEQGRGLPIGDLTSQLFSNVYLNELDQYVKRVLKCRHYGRYVDDFYIIDSDIEKLRSYCSRITDFLKNSLGLEVNAKKTKIHPVDWPIQFLGQRIHPYYFSPSGRIIHNFRRTTGKICEECESIKRLLPYGGHMDEDLYIQLSHTGDEKFWHDAVNSHSKTLNNNLSIFNSYLGYLKHDKSFHLVDGLMSSNQCKSMKTIYCFDENYRKASISFFYKHKYLVV